MTTIKLHPPKDLPEEGLSAVAFEAWHNQAISFLEQETINYEFISGLYSDWKAKQDTADGKRIARLADDDTDKKVIEAKTGAAAEAAKPAQLVQLLTKRNSQLSKVIQLVANMCQYSEQSDILQLSTSLSWIWDYLKRHYNIETRGSHLLDVAAINPKQDQKPIVFYKQFRSGVLNNLRKRGDKVLFKASHQLTEDEVVSPTFECIIMMWALEKLDPRLPSKVKKDFGFRMEGDTTLMDLQTAVFQAVPGMIEELDETAEAKGISLKEEDEDPSLAGMGARGKYQRGSRPFRPFRGRGGRPFRPPFARRGQTAGRAEATNNKRPCRLCKLAGKTEAVYFSHNIGNCQFFTEQDEEDLMSGISSFHMVGDTVNTGPDSPFYELDEEDPTD